MQMNLETEVSAKELLLGGYQSVVLATGVTPREIPLPNSSSLDAYGQHSVRVVSYYDVLTRQVAVGKRVAIIGAGGIGFDVADFLLHNADNHTIDESVEVPLAKAVDNVTVDRFLNEWGIDRSTAQLSNSHSTTATDDCNDLRQIYLLQRKPGKLGAGLGKTTGWIHRTNIKKKGVKELSGCQYLGVSDSGLTVKRGDKEEVLPVDTVVICAGQEPLRDLLGPLAGNISLIAGFTRIFILGVHTLQLLTFQCKSGY